MASQPPMSATPAPAEAAMAPASSETPTVAPQPQSRAPSSSSPSSQPETASSPSDVPPQMEKEGSKASQRESQRDLEPFGPLGHTSTYVREVLGVGTLVCAMLTTQAGLGMVIWPLEVIGAGFGVENDPGQMSWFASAYSLSVGTVILPAGRIGDMYGHKKALVFGYAWTSFWCLIAGFSSYVESSPIFFDVCRGLQGIGYSFLLPNAVAILARCTHPGHWKRALYFTVFAATAPNGALLGALFSSLIAQFHPDKWEFAFYLACVCLAGLSAVAFVFLPSDRYLRDFHGSGDSDDDEVQGFDAWGTATALVGLILFNFAWNQAGVVGWQVAYNPVLMVVGLIFIAVFLYVETRVKHPLIPREVWTTQNCIILGCLALGWSSFGIWLFYSVRWWINIRNATLLSAVAMATPCGLAGCVAAGLSMVLLSKLGPAPTMLFALCAFATSSSLIASMPEQQIYWAQSFPSWCIAPGGMDASFPAASLIIANSLPQHRQGVAGSLVNTIVNYSVAFGLGLAGTVERQTNGGGTDLFNGYRNCLFLGVGLAGAGVCLAGGTVVAELTRRWWKPTDTEKGDHRE